MTEDPTTGPGADGQDLTGAGAASEDAASAPAATGQAADAPGAADDDAGHDGAGEPDEELSAIEKAQAEMLAMADDLARAKADIYNAEQRHKAYVQRSRTEVAGARQQGREDVVEALIAVLDDVELARQHGELEGPFKSIAEKLENALAQNFEVERYGESGDEFDPNIHEALMHNAKEGVETDVIDVVMQPGYRVGERVVRPARVGVAGPA